MTQTCWTIYLKVVSDVPVVMEDITVLIVSTSWVLFASSAVYFAYKAHCNNIMQRSVDSVLKVSIELLDAYRKARESELKRVPLLKEGIGKGDEKNTRNRGEKSQEDRG